jgi:hypothetical protein
MGDDLNFQSKGQIGILIATLAGVVKLSSPGFPCNLYQL